MLIASINGMVYRSARYGAPPAPRSYATPNAVEDGKPRQHAAARCASCVLAGILISLIVVGHRRVSRGGGSGVRCGGGLPVSRARGRGFGRCALRRLVAVLHGALCRGGCGRDGGRVHGGGVAAAAGAAGAVGAAAAGRAMVLRSAITALRPGRRLHGLRLGPDGGGKGQQLGAAGVRLSDSRQAAARAARAAGLRPRCSLRAWSAIPPPPPGPPPGPACFGLKPNPWCWRV